MIAAMDAAFNNCYIYYSLLFCFYLLKADLFVENDNAAGFTFQSKHYCVNKGRQGTINDLMFGQFVTTSTKEPQYYCQKNIYKPMYMDPDHILTHVPRPANSSGHIM